MFEGMTILLRAHTEVLKQPTSRRAKLAQSQPAAQKSYTKAAEPTWPEYALVLDCETTTDSSQALTFGMFRFCRILGNTFLCIEEGVFYADDLQETNPGALTVLKRYVENIEAETPPGYAGKIRLLTRSEFVEHGLWGAGVKAKALIVGFNLPFESSQFFIHIHRARIDTDAD